MQNLLFYIAYALIRLVSVLPFWLVYRLSDFIYFILYYIIGYRKEVTKSNIRTAFPHLDEKEVTRIAKASTRHFCDIFIEMMKSLHISKEEMHKRFTCTNAEMVNAFAKADKSIVVLFGHAGSYEWSMVLDEVLHFNVYAIYKPIKNKKFNQLITDIRKKFGSTMVPMRHATRVMSEKADNERCLFALVADQAPKRARSQYFTNFFNKPSAVFRGGERIAAEHGLPVFFLAIKKIKRGYYETTFHKITDDASKEPEWLVTDKFFSLLEDQIKMQPEYYLWSHKRWKTSLQDVKRDVELSPSIQR
ncbi:MAG: lysophospholipid acyltransferase family protein [Bacteroidota bacterium]|nr:lysophospholipid acyltransferase family protein [Bacteroidota bacterium]